MKLKDCYFQATDDGDFIITPKELFDKEGVMDDSGEEPSDLPKGFYELQESEYEYEGSILEGKNALIKGGAVEKKMFE